MNYRDHTKKIRIGDRVIGGGNPILIQSMTNTPTRMWRPPLIRSWPWKRPAARSSAALSRTEAAEASKEIKKQDPYSAGGGYPF